MTVYVDNREAIVDTSSRDGEWVIGMKDGYFCDLNALPRMSEYELNVLRKDVHHDFLKHFDSFVEFFYDTETANHLH